jgi:hypothetical protein
MDEHKLSAENVADFMDSDNRAAIADMAIALLADMEGSSEGERCKRAIDCFDSISIVVAVFRQEDNDACPFGFYVAKGLALLQQRGDELVYGFPCGSFEEAKDLWLILGDGRVLQ